MKQHILQSLFLYSIFTVTYQMRYALFAFFAESPFCSQALVTFDISLLDQYIGLYLSNLFFLHQWMMLCWKVNVYYHKKHILKSYWFYISLNDALYITITLPDQFLKVIYLYLNAFAVDYSQSCHNVFIRFACSKGQIPYLMRVVEYR